MTSVSAKKGTFSVKAYRGDAKTLLAFNVTAQVRRPGCELAIDFSRQPNRFSI